MTTAAKPNPVVREVRESQLRMSRDEFARHVNATAAAMGENTGCTARLIAAWERGEVASPRPVYERVLHELTGRALSDLGFSPSRAATGSVKAAKRVTLHKAQHPGLPPGGASSERPDSGTLDDMIRRELLRLLSVTGAFVSLPQSADAPSRESPCAEDIRERGALNAHLWSVYGLTPAKRSVYPLVRDQLSSLTSALQIARKTRDRRELCGMVGDVAQLAGEVWFDANRYTEAAHCYALAADASKQAGNMDLWACGLVRHSFVSIYSRRYNEALPLLDAAASLAWNGDSQLPTRRWVASVRAQVLARLGDVDGCSRALDEAETVRELSTTAPGGWLRFNGDRLAEERGSAFTSLGRLDLAEQALTHALDEPLSPRRRGSVLIDLAVIGASRRDVDQLVSHGTRAMDLAHHTGSGYIARRLDGLRSHLTPFLSDKRVLELSDRMTALGV